MNPNLTLSHPTAWTVFIQSSWYKLQALAIVTVLSFTVYAPSLFSEELANMPQSGSISYADAFRYAAAWASSVNVSTTDLTRNPHDFYGHLGSLDFFYSENDHVLHIWSFVMDSAGPLLTSRSEIKETLDQIAQTHPEETAGGVFEIRTLEWNRQVTPALEPCLWLRTDVTDATAPVKEVVKRLDHFSTAGYTWGRYKMLELMRDYWKKHPKKAQ